MKENKMGTMPMTKLIFSMSLPAMFSMLIQALYNIVDSIFVSFLGENALTAVSLVYPMQMLIISFAVGTGVGINSLISRRLGEKEYDEASHAANHGLVLGFITWIIFALIGIFFTKPFISSMAKGASDVSADIINWGVDYMWVVMVFSFGVFIEVSIEKSIQATGNMLYPMIFQLIGAVINLIFDPIFIFGFGFIPAMGVKGAAIATVMGQIIAMFYALYIALKKDFHVKFTLKNFKFRLKTVKDIYVVGIPSIVMQSIASVLITFLNKILIVLTPTAVTVLGVYYKLQSFVFMPVFGLTQGVMPIMGYNYGARNSDRVKKSFKLLLTVSLTYTVLLWACVMLAPGAFARLFTTNAELIEFTTHAMRIYCGAMFFLGIQISCQKTFVSIGNAPCSIIVAVLRKFVLLIPLIYILPAFLPDKTTAVYLAEPVADAIAVTCTAFLFAWQFKKALRKLEQPASVRKKEA